MQSKLGLVTGIARLLRRYLGWRDDVDCLGQHHADSGAVLMARDYLRAAPPAERHRDSAVAQAGTQARFELHFVTVPLAAGHRAS